jgi:arsenate reductase
MAEAFVNARRTDLEAYSAGLEPGTLNPVVVEAMREIGIDISGNRTKRIDDLVVACRDYDYVITVCDEASAERCPIYPTQGKRLHWSFTDPSALVGSEEDKLKKTRKIRDEIRHYVEDWVGKVSGGHESINQRSQSDSASISS